MSRQTFLASEFFVPASEEEARKAIYALPDKYGQISFLKENLLLQTFRFLFDDQLKPLKYYVDVSVLPLNEQYVRICLHCSHLNGHAFYTDPEMSQALLAFEQAVRASFKKEQETIECYSKPKQVKKPFSLASFLHSMLFSKYHY